MSTNQDNQLISDMIYAEHLLAEEVEIEEETAEIQREVAEYQRTQAAAPEGEDPEKHSKEVTAGSSAADSHEPSEQEMRKIVSRVLEEDEVNSDGKEDVQDDKVDDQSPAGSNNA